MKEVVEKDFAGRIEFLAQNVETGDFGDPVFKPYTMRSLGGVPVAIIGQAFPTRPSPIRAASSPTGRFGIEEKRLQGVVDEARGKGAAVVALLSHNGMDVDLKLASRVTGIDVILGGHTHDAVPVPILVRNRRGQDARHQRGFEREVPRRSRSRGPGRQGLAATATGCCRCSRTCFPPIPRWQS